MHWELFYSLVPAQHLLEERIDHALYVGILRWDIAMTIVGMVVYIAISLYAISAETYLAQCLVLSMKSQHFPV